MTIKNGNEDIESDIIIKKGIEKSGIEKLSVSLSINDIICAYQL